MRPRKTKPQIERRRRTAITLVRRQVSFRETARQVGASVSSVQRWWALYQAGGRRALRPTPDRGRAPRLTPAQQARLVKLLVAGPRAQGYATEWWTIARVAEVIARRFRVTYSVAGAWLLLGRLGWSCQKPARRARERNEAAIRRWRRVTWPKLRKRGRA